MNKKTMIIVAVVLVAIMCVVFRYEETVYGNKKYRYDRFTKTVYFTGVYMKNPVWRKTRFVSMDHALQYEKRRELQELADEAENKRQAMQDELEDRQLEVQYELEDRQQAMQSELEDKQREIENEMQRRQRETEQQQRDLEQKQRDLEYQLRRNR